MGQGKKKKKTLTWFHVYGFSYHVGTIVSRGFGLQIKLKLHKDSLNTLVFD